MRELLDAGTLDRLGTQSRLADLFGVSRQRVHQIVNDERADFIPAWMRR